MASIAMAVLPGPTKESTPARMRCSTALLHPQRPINPCNPCHKPRLQRERADATFTEVAKKLTQAYLNILNIFLSTKKQHLRLQPVAGGLYAGCFLATLPTLTVAAMKAAFKLLPFETQEALVPTNIELRVSYEGEHKLYVNAFRSFINKPCIEQTQTAQEQHRLQQQRGSKRRQRLTLLQQRRLQRQAQTIPTPMT